jgi:hypothetical protein
MSPVKDKKNVEPLRLKLFRQPRWNLNGRSVDKFEQEQKQNSWFSFLQFDGKIPSKRFS